MKTVNSCFIWFTQSVATLLPLNHLLFVTIFQNVNNIGSDYVKNISEEKHDLFAHSFHKILVENEIIVMNPMRFVCNCAWKSRWKRGFNRSIVVYRERGGIGGRVWIPQQHKKINEQRFTAKKSQRNTATATHIFSAIIRSSTLKIILLYLNNFPQNELITTLFIANMSTLLRPVNQSSRFCEETFLEGSGRKEKIETVFTQIPLFFYFIHFSCCNPLSKIRVVPLSLSPSERHEKASKKWPRAILGARVVLAPRISHGYIFSRVSFASRSSRGLSERGTTRSLPTK